MTPMIMKQGRHPTALIIKVSRNPKGSPKVMKIKKRNKTLVLYLSGKYSEMMVKGTAEVVPKNAPLTNASGNNWLELRTKP